MIQPDQTSDRSGAAEGAGRGAELRAPPALIARADMKLAAARDFDEALRALASIVIPAAADWFAVDLVSESGGLRRVAIEHQDPGKVEKVRALERHHPRPADAAHGPPEVVRTGRTEMVPEVTDDVLRRIARDDRHLKLLRGLELSSYVVTPLMARGRTLGALTFVFAESGRHYDEDARLFLEDLSSRAALTLANNQLIEELENARRRAEEHLAQVEEKHREKEALLASTSRRTAEHRVQLLGRILDESLNEIYIFDATTLRFVQVNRGARDNLGYSMDELREMTPLDIKPEFTVEDFAAAIEPLRDGRREAVRFETRHQRKDGSLYPVEVNVQLSPSEQGRLYVAVILDISDRRAAEEERERLIQDLERANSIKADFVSTMSHELRTPLNAVIGYAQLLKDGVPVPIPGEALAHVRRIDLSAHHLLQLIDEILTFSKLEAGRESVMLAPITVAGLLDEVRAVLEPMATAKGLDFTTSAGGAPRSFRSDPKKLRQILLHLAGNAVKFTERGHVSLRVRADGEQVVFSVSDTGIGIAPHEQRRMFEPFWQADQSPTRQAGGTGLGLAIARRFVEVLGGSIHVESAAGEGTTFTVALPLDPATRDGNE